MGQKIKMVGLRDEIYLFVINILRIKFIWWQIWSYFISCSDHRCYLSKIPTSLTTIPVLVLTTFSFMYCFFFFFRIWNTSKNNESLNIYRSIYWKQKIKKPYIKQVRELRVIRKIMKSIKDNTYYEKGLVRF